MDEQPDSSQQLMDILLVMDEKGTPKPSAE